MNILVTGSHGLIGTALVPLLTSKGHRVVRLVRSPTPAAPDQVVWDPAAGTLDPTRLEGMDAAIHLAGENIASGRWTPARKARIRASRVRATRLLADAIARLSRRPRVLLSASAVGYYGDRGDELLVEESAPGTGFLAEVCRDWEAATEPARRAGVRVAYLRSGVVLSDAGGALARLLPVFRAGLGGRLGSGRQYMSWIALDDEIESICFALDQDSLDGPVNLVSPHPVTNQEFTVALGRALRRPTPFAVPSGALRLVLGELADELLGSVRVQPARLLASAYAFRYPALDGALRHLLEARPHPPTR